MKKAVILFLFLATIRQLSFAQFMIGPQAGFDLATVTGSSFSVSAKPGWSAGVFISIPFSKHFSLMPAALYSMRGFKYSYDTMSTLTQSLDTITITTTVNVNASLGYLDVPALFAFFVQEAKGFMIQAGPQISFLITDNSTITNTIT